MNGKTKSKGMSGLIDAISKFEGFGASASNAPTRNNNPGDIVFGPFAASYGATKDPASAFAVFPDSATGFQAANDLLSGPAYSGLSLSAAISKWNGGGANSGDYTNYVASYLGVDPNTLVSDIIAGGGGSSLSDALSPSNDLGSGFDIGNGTSLVVVGVGLLAGLWLITEII